MLETVQEENEEDSEAMLPIGELSAVALHVPAVEASRRRVAEEMESMVERGLAELVRLLAALHRCIADRTSVGQPTPRIISTNGAQSLSTAVTRPESLAGFDGFCLEKSQSVFRHRLAVEGDGISRFVIVLLRSYLR